MVGAFLAPSEVTLTCRFSHLTLRGNTAQITSLLSERGGNKDHGHYLVYRIYHYKIYPLQGWPHYSHRPACPPGPGSEDFSGRWALLAAGMVDGLAGMVTLVMITLVMFHEMFHE